MRHPRLGVDTRPCKRVTTAQKILPHGESLRPVVLRSTAGADDVSQRHRRTRLGDELNRIQCGANIVINAINDERYCARFDVNIFLSKRQQSLETFSLFATAIMYHLGIMQKAARNDSASQQIIKSFILFLQLLLNGALLWAFFRFLFKDTMLVSMTSTEQN